MSATTPVDQASTKAWRLALRRERVIEWTRSLFLPNANAAEVPESKIVGYLLSTTHTAGKSKAAFFGKHGFVIANWHVLARALREHAAKNPVLQTDETAFGKRYVVDGELLAPDGTILNVRSVWFITTETTIPRFATAHPLKRKDR
jgi:hypothetical protein